jgi:cobalt/nickel transport system permease protein
MHIPDGFLSTPVWASLGAVSLPTVGVLARKAESHGRAPLLGVMGAFVFAAQMVNFPVAGGASSHLLGGALLACSLGPAAGVIVMTAVLAIQAFVFQDGGILALGANVFNLAIAGVLTAYFPYALWGNGRHRKAAIFTGAVLSVLVSAGLAMSQILLSGIPVERPLLQLSAALFVVSAVLEGAITIAVIGAIEKINPEWVRHPAERRSPALVVVGAASVLIALASIFVASSQPDALGRIEAYVPTTALLNTPFADYRFAPMLSEPGARAVAAILGVSLVYLLCLGIGRVIAYRRSV